MAEILQSVTAGGATSLAFTLPVRLGSILVLWLNTAAPPSSGASDGSNGVWRSVGSRLLGNNGEMAQMYIMPRSVATAAAPTVTFGATSVEAIIAEIAVPPSVRAVIFDPNATGRTAGPNAGPSAIDSGAIAFGATSGIAIGLIDDVAGTVTLTSPWQLVATRTNNETLNGCVLDITAAGNYSLTTTTTDFTFWIAMICGIAFVPLKTTRTGAGSRAWPSKWPRRSE